MPVLFPWHRDYDMPISYGDSAMIQIQPEYATAVSLNLPDDLSYEGWLAAARFARDSEQGWQWWLCDLVLWADAHGIGARADQALIELKFAARTLTNKRHLGKVFPQTRRRPQLSFRHHEAVAYGLANADADALLDQAALQNWSSDELRKQVKHLKGSKGDEQLVDNAPARRSAPREGSDDAESSQPGSRGTTANDGAARLNDLYRATLTTQRVIAESSDALAALPMVQMAAMFARNALRTLTTALERAGITAP